MIIFAELMVQYKPFLQMNLVLHSCQNVTAGNQQIFQSTRLGTIIVDADIVDYERERGKPVSGAKGTEKAIFQIEHRQGISLPQPTGTLPRRLRTPTCDFFSMSDETPLVRR